MTKEEAIKFESEKSCSKCKYNTATMSNIQKHCVVCSRFYTDKFKDKETKHA